MPDTHFKKLTWRRPQKRGLPTYHLLLEYDSHRAYYGIKDGVMQRFLEHEDWYWDISEVHKDSDEDGEDENMPSFGCEPRIIYFTCKSFLQSFAISYDNFYKEYKFE